MVTLGTLALTVIVELFTSEGCSSCPPADTFLQKLVETQPVEDVQIVALGEHVDYWDRLGWKDRFSSAVFTARQQAYRARFAIESIYTPQMVVDGRAEFVGTDAKAARTALERARDAAHGTLNLTMQGGPEALVLEVSATATHLPALAAGDHADVLVAVTEDRLRTDVKHGENGGRVLSHAPVVRVLSQLGEVSPPGSSTLKGRIHLGADWKRENLRVVAFVQARRSRAILAATTVQAPK